ncbi:hypothetical protein [Botrimarina mediterranea]|uniref:Uncharacterized protein n=1 Tax=Botrimarina mediterranea TaxID=2528022 RepID=A0A518K3T9_9BACT|nr:hypothetical protein [Botrimarina mediterranea]QDV72473.1 hypothetical protein Spa11_06510 [Botrimarina mediterranea]QDV77043.1 hypothetical protein K2D_06300 [Planctomycetes bacterium K2D]
MQRDFNIFGLNGNYEFAGKPFPSREAAEAAQDAFLEETTAKLGRAPSRIERQSGQVKATRDSRPVEQQHLDSYWKPKAKAKLPPTREEIALQIAIEKRDAERLRKMDQFDRDVYLAEQAILAKQDKQLAKEATARHLEKVAPQLTKLEALYDSERWSSNADAGYRQLLEMAHAQLSLVDGCPLESKRLLARIDEVREARQVQSLFETRQQLEQLAAKEAALSSGRVSLAAGFEVSETDEQREALGDQIFDEGEAE